MFPYSVSGRLTWTALVFVAFTACSDIPDPAPRRVDAESRRSLPAGEVVGFAAEYDSHAWLGLPYAMPPVGEGRWRAPQPAAPWQGVREALATGEVCSQLATPIAGVSDVPPGTPVGSEDCLFLNVWAPRFSPEAVPAGNARLPVMLWIHGGGNTIGHAGFYHGGNLAASQGLIVIAINYRLGPFGWFRHAALRGDGTSAADRSGNFGILDMIRALEWVQANVAAFGGDPGRVTIFGESAGGHDVVALLASKLADGLFHRAIVQSGSTDSVPPSFAENYADAAVPGHPHSSAEILTRLMLADASASDTETARRLVASMDDPEIADYLRSKTNREIQAAYIEDGEDDIRLPRVFADGFVLPRQDILARFGRRGAYNAVPVMLGTNRDENKLFLAIDPDHADRWLGIVPRPHDPDSFFPTAEYLSLMWKATGADEPAIALRASQGPSVYVYRFDWDEEPSLPGVRMAEVLGASHGFEIPFVFGHWDLGPEAVGLFTPFNRSGRVALSERMMSYWAQFAYTGDPGSGRDGSLPTWTAWDDSRDDAHRYILLDTAADGGVRMGSEPVTVASVLAAVEADQRLESQRDRCFVYAMMASWEMGMTEASYPSAGRDGCAPYPYEAFPWNEAGDG